MSKYRNQGRSLQYIKLSAAILGTLLVIVGQTKGLGEYRQKSVFYETKTETELIYNNDASQKNKEGSGTDTEETRENTEDRNIRVLIMNDNYNGSVHSEVVLSSNGDMTVSYGKKSKTVKAGKKLKIQPDDKRFSYGNIEVTSKKRIKITNLKRGCGISTYDGKLELFSTAEGIAVVNELPVEKYLCAVVPSEMPASYEPEALKAQAVCARSYAYRQMKEYAYPEYKAHVNDSTDYQVYGNSKRQKSTTQAVKSTEGETVRYKGKTVTTYFYSTSSGKTTTLEAWGKEVDKNNTYLKSVSVSGENGDYERELPWYKWTATIPVTTLSKLIGLNTGKDIGTVKKVKVIKRGAGDVVQKVKITGEKGSVTVETENKIRTVFGGNGYQIEKQDGTVVDSMELLPSAFFTIKKKNDTFVIKGGGFGHGIGMSQNGANEMAKEGKNYKEILQLFYSNVKIK